MDASTLVGRNLRRIRVSRGLSQEQLGLLVGCEPSYVGRVERGRENPTVRLLEAMARACDVPIADLFASLPDGEVPAGLPRGRKPKGTVQV